MNQSAVALRREVYTMPNGEEFGEVGFTPEDRKALYTLLANEKNLYDRINQNQHDTREMFKDLRVSLERRMETLERERAHKEDLSRVERELRADIAEKADRRELSGSALEKLSECVEKLESRCDEQETRVTWAYAWCAGAIFVASIVGWLLSSFLKRG